MTASHGDELKALVMDQIEFHKKTNSALTMLVEEKRPHRTEVSAHARQAHELTSCHVNVMSCRAMSRRADARCVHESLNWCAWNVHDLCMKCGVHGKCSGMCISCGVVCISCGVHEYHAPRCTYKSFRMMIQNACKVHLKRLLAQSLVTIMTDSANAMSGILPRDSEITVHDAVKSALAKVAAQFPKYKEDQPRAGPHRTFAAHDVAHALATQD